MRNLIIILIFVISQPGFSQLSYADSLLQAVERSTNDSVRFRINFNLANYYFDRDRRKTFEYNEVALQIARENNKMLDVAKCLGKAL